MTGHRRGALAVAATIALLVAGCSSSDDTVTSDVSDAPTATGSTSAVDSATEAPVASSDGDAEELFPDVVGVDANQADDGTWTFRVTLSSPYDTPERYADAWRVEAPDGTVLGIRELAHDHQNEQPFTRATSGVEIPDELDRVMVRGRDQVSGWSPDASEYELPR